jgi:DNA-binding beta-propeller fold protein YncE
MGEGRIRNCVWLVLALAMLVCAPSANASNLTPLPGIDGCLAVYEPLSEQCATGASSEQRYYLSGIALSPDGAHAYTANADGDVRALTRNVVTGALMPIAGACWEFEPRTSDCNPADGMQQPTAIAISPDGLDVYVGTAAGTIALFRRNIVTGALTQQAAPHRCVGDAASRPAYGCSALSGLGGADRTHLIQR